MHTVFALLFFVVVIHWLIFPYPSGLLHWHCGNLMIVPVPAKQPWWIWIHTSCEFIMNDCITTTKQSTTKPCAYFLAYTVWMSKHIPYETMGVITYSYHNLIEPMCCWLPETDDRAPMDFCYNWEKFCSEINKAGHHGDVALQVSILGNVFIYIMIIMAQVIHGSRQTLIAYQTTVLEHNL